MLNWLRSLFSAGPAGPSVSSFEFLAVDMHAHWLPGIDDGAKNMDESLAMIGSLQSLGFQKLIATPHIMADLYPNTPAIIQDRLSETRRACAAAGIEIELEAAAEYLLDDGFEKHLDRYGPLTFGDNYILIEFGFFQPPLQAENVFFQLLAAGYRPILAHPERYAYFHDKPRELNKLRERGVKLQVNTLSLLGHYGKRIQSSAINLVTEGMADFLGTDAHSRQHLRTLGQALNSERRNLPVGEHTFLNKTLR
jgi:tyrosine-protein phosphatase YwqE